MAREGLTFLRNMNKGIFYDEKEKQFSIEGESFSSIFYINQYGILVNLYLGEKLQKPLDKALLVREDIWNDYRYLEEGAEKQLPGDGFVMEWAPVEVGSYGRNDFRVPFAIVSENDDSTRTTDFRYLSYSIYKGRKPLRDFPFVKGEDDATTLEITLKESESELFLTLFYVYYPRLDVLLRHSSLQNKTGKKVKVLRLSSFEMDFRTSSFILQSFGGGYAHEFSISRSVLTEGKKTLSSNRGLSSHEMNPVFILSNKETGETSGFCLGGAFVYSGDFSFEFEVDSLKQLRVVGGVNPETLEYGLCDGEVLETPEMAFAFSCSGLSALSSSFHALVRDDVVKKEEKPLSDYVLLNSWEAYYFSFNTKKVLGAIDKAAEWGISLFVLDDGWFGKRDADTSSLGDWVVNEGKINLSEVIDHAHSLKMRFGLWVEPEMVSMDSDLFRSHPDWAMLSPNRIHALHRHQLLLDLSNDEVEEYLFTTLDALFTKFKVDYVKWDYNSDSYEHPSFDGACLRRYRNLYRLLGALQAAHPSILFETCAGGGGRFDLAMMSYSSRIWASDNQDSSDRSFIQYGASFFYPPETVSAHVNKAISDEAFKIKEGVAFFGSFGYELDPFLAKGGLVKKGTSLYHSFHDIISKGSYFRLLSPYEDGAYGAECLFEGKIALLLNPLKGYAKKKIVPVRLEEGKTYKNLETGEEYAPSRLQEGLSIEDFASSSFGNVIFLG